MSVISLYYIDGGKNNITHAYICVHTYKTRALTQIFKHANDHIQQQHTHTHIHPETRVICVFASIS